MSHRRPMRTPGVMVRMGCCPDREDHMSIFGEPRQFASLEEVRQHLDDITVEEMNLAYETLGIAFELAPGGVVLGADYAEGRDVPDDRIAACG